MAEAEQARAPADDSAARARTANLWRHRDFLLLWSGQSVSELGSAVTVLALPLTAVVVLRASTFEVGLLTAATYAAFLLIALPAGAVVDRVAAKRRLMLGCDAARMLIIGSIPVAAAFGALTLGQLFAVAVLAGVCTVFFDVAYQSYLPVLVTRDQLIEGNGKLGATQALAQVIGPGIGGALVGLVGAARTMTADALSYAVSVGSLLLIRTPEPPRTARESAGSAESAVARLRKDIGEGLTFVTRQPVLRKVVACTGTSNLFSAMTTALEIIFLVRVLHVRTGIIGVLIALGSLGGVAGGASSGFLGRRIGSARIIWVSMLVFGLPGMLIPLAEPGWRVSLFAVGWFSFEFGAVTYNVAQVSYRQAICPPALLGRMNAAVRWIVWGTMPLGGLLGGTLGTVLGVRPTLWIAVIGSWAAGFFVFFSPLRTMRDFPAHDAEASPGDAASADGPSGPGPARAFEGRERDDPVEVGVRPRVECAAAGDEPEGGTAGEAVDVSRGEVRLGVERHGADPEHSDLVIAQGDVDPVPPPEVTEPVEHGGADGS
jgi:MFS family permease